MARAFEVNPALLHRWRMPFCRGSGNAFPGEGKRHWEKPKVAQLERKVGQQVLKIDLLKGYLQRIEEQRMLQALLENRDLPACLERNRKRGRGYGPRNVRAEEG